MGLFSSISIIAKELMSSVEVREMIGYVKDLVDEERDVQSEMEAFTIGFYHGVEGKYRCSTPGSVSSLRHSDASKLYKAFYAGVDAGRSKEPHLRAKHNYFNHVSH